MNDPRITGQIPALVDLEPGDKRSKASIALIKFLAFHNRLEGTMAFVAVWWALWTLAFPLFWHDWPVSEEIARRSFGHPEVYSWVLLLAGCIGYIGRLRCIRPLRLAATFCSFLVWSLITMMFATTQPMYSPAVASYSAFAIATLMSYVYVEMGVEQLFHHAQNIRRGQDDRKRDERLD